MIRFTSNLIILLAIFVSGLTGQDIQITHSANNNHRVNIFIDCPRWRCDMDYIRTHLTVVNYVYEPTDADVYILVTSQGTGSGGREYTFCFYGQHNFINLNDTLIYVSHQDATDDDIRKGILRILKLGLIRYFARTPQADQIRITFKDVDEPIPIVDYWDSWVFRARLNGRISGEQRRNSYSIYGRISANRITDDWKIRLSISSNYNEDNFDTEEGVINSYARSKNLWGLFVKSMSEHWSIGGYTGAYSSTYSNIRGSGYASPAIEYNYFPYSESTRRELRFLYRFGYEYRAYYQETIYSKFEEGLLKQILSFEYEVKQPWGSIDTEVTASNYLHDFSKSRVQLTAAFELRLFKGLSLDIWSGFSMIHDQLSLAKEDITTEEILLQRKQLETQYQYWGSIGFSYTFGSIYNNIVNPRFGT
jgi:hypothetical protein